jgi:assimilatory nitrate reductase electron transfer subunit
VDAIASCTRATTGCGTCRPAVDGIVDWLAAADAAPSA